MLPLQLIALVAMVPAAANPALMAQGEALALAQCGGGAAVISIPLDQPLPGMVPAACCNKGCHGDQKRKRGKSAI